MTLLRKRSIIPAFLILLVWVMPVVAEVIPEKCCCCIMSQCQCGCEEKKHERQGPLQGAYLPLEMNCDCSFNENNTHNFYVSGSIKINNNIIIIKYSNDQYILSVLNNTFLSHINNHSSKSSLFLLKSSFLL